MNILSHGLLVNLTETVVKLTYRLGGISSLNALSTSQWEVNERSKSKLAITNTQEVSGPFCIY